MAWTYPHEFHDGIGETASGVQVNDNFAKAKEKIEAAEAALVSTLSRPTSRTRAERALNSLFEESASRAALVTTTVNGVAGYDVEIINDGTVEARLQTGGSGTLTTTFLVDAGKKWQAHLNVGSGMKLDVTRVLL